jgi:hypothetical protein
MIRSGTSCFFQIPALFFHFLRMLARESLRRRTVFRRKRNRQSFDRRLESLHSAPQPREERGGATTWTKRQDGLPGVRSAGDVSAGQKLKRRVHRPHSPLSNLARLAKSSGVW